MRGVWVERLIAGSVYQKKGGGVNIQIRRTKTAV